jgi:hypothetical protein
MRNPARRTASRLACLHTCRDTCICNTEGEPDPSRCAEESLPSLYTVVYLSAVLHPERQAQLLHAEAPNCKSSDDGKVFVEEEEQKEEAGSVPLGWLIRRLVGLDGAPHDCVASAPTKKRLGMGVDGTWTGFKV